MLGSLITLMPQQGVALMFDFMTVSQQGELRSMASAFIKLRDACIALMPVNFFRSFHLLVA